jgi:hypothetical protein
VVRVLGSILWYNFGRNWQNYILNILTLR